MKSIFQIAKKPLNGKEGKAEFIKRCTHTYTSRYPFLTKSQIKFRVNMAWKKKLSNQKN